MRRMFGIKLTEDERRQIEEAAQREGRAPSNLARHLIMTALRKEDNEPTLAPAKHQGGVVGVTASAQ
jgi:hypothetical protein